MSGRAVAVVSITAALVVAGCTGSETDQPPVVTVGSGELRLASFDSCDQALDNLKEAILPQVGPYGLNNGGGLARDTAGTAAGGAAEAVPPMAEKSGGDARAQSAAADEAAPGSHSTTNTHEAGVDEPDVVKTDGKRIVTVVDGTLRVVDAASRTLTATLPLPSPGGADELLLSGDHALVIRRGGFSVMEDRIAQPDVIGKPVDGPVGGAELLLVTLTGTPAVQATFTIDGRFVDARMVGQTVRVVTHSEPRLSFGFPQAEGAETESLRLNRDVVERSTLDDWLPRYQLKQAGSVQDGRIDCAAMIHPARYSATSMLTVLSFDLGATTLGTGDPVTIVADGDIVYGTAGSLYVASDAGRAWTLRGGGLDLPQAPGSLAPQQPQERTELYKFDTSGTGKPRHVASGAVPGSLLNQYSMSEFDGHLRVATTLGGPAGASSVYVLAQRDTVLEKVGEVGGLGKGERIYAVRFIGPLGYVVTFRQTDPLYTLDLRKPTAPAVTGELKITGYSAYLHPAGDGRLIGVGQEASEQGRTLGTQVSLFDVADPAAPSRIAQYHVPDSSSEAEHDPHAFLYWPATRTLVLPITAYSQQGDFAASATVLNVGDAALTEVGRLNQPTTAQYPQPIRRTLVIGGTLWTISPNGAAAHDLTTLGAQGWVGFAM